MKLLPGSVNMGKRGWMNMQNVSMIVLAGGESSRMGTDKSDLIYKGRSFLEIQADKAQALQIRDVLVSGYRGSLQTNYPIIPDQTAGKGPLGGLATCLEAIENDRALVLSVDAPLVPAEVLKKLVAYAINSTCKAVISKCGQHQYPLIGVYHRSLAPAMLEEIELHRGSVFAMLRRVEYDVCIFDEDPVLFSNINDPESYNELLNR